MTIWILTLFPEAFAGVFTTSILKRAQLQKLLKIKIINIRDFAKDHHHTVDDKPYGGGAGMILKVDVLDAVLSSIKPKPYTILLSANGALYNQQKAQAFSRKVSLALICGHYEGVDVRVEKFVDEVISIGDFVLTGGEIATMAIVDSVARLVPGVIKKESRDNESFSPTSNLLEFPQYTRPALYKGLKVPSVLLRGNHQQIAQWRHQKALKRTQKFRPDLIDKAKVKIQKSK